MQLRGRNILELELFVTHFLVSVEKLATTVLKLANMSKDADTIIKGCRHWESNTMNNEVEIETTDNNLREARKIGWFGSWAFRKIMLGEPQNCLVYEIEINDILIEEAHIHVLFIEITLLDLNENS